MVCEEGSFFVFMADLNFLWLDVVPFYAKLNGLLLNPLMTKNHSTLILFVSTVEQDHESIPRKNQPSITHIFRQAVVSARRKSAPKTPVYMLYNDADESIDHVLRPWR